MQKEHLRLGLIYGSNRDNRTGQSIMNWVLKQVQHLGCYEIEIIDIKSEELAPLLLGEQTAISLLKSKVSKCDGFIVVSPEYNHSFPAPLKAVIDSANVEWAAKPVAFVTYGGIGGGIRALEQLRLVFASLHAVGLRDAVNISCPWDKFDDDGQFVHGEIGAARAFKYMNNTLIWWAKALLSARTLEAYEGVRLG